MDLFGKGMSLFFNMLFMLVTTFLPRRKHLLISLLQSPSAVILEPPKSKVRMQKIKVRIFIYNSKQWSHLQNLFFKFFRQWAICFFPITCSSCSWKCSVQSVQFSRSVVSNSLRPHESQHARPPHPSPTPRVYLNLCPSSWWCHPATSSSVVPFSSCPQSFPGSGSFPMSQLFASGGQSIGVSASASVLPMNTQDWSPLGWTSWICLQSKGLSRVFSNTTVQKHQFFGAQLSSQPNSHIHTWPLGKP